MLYSILPQKKEWLPWPSDTNVGIEPKDTLSFHQISQEKYNSLTKEEAFALMTVPFIIEKLDIFLSKVLGK